MAFEHIWRAIREFVDRVPSRCRLPQKHRRRQLRIDPLEERHLLAIDASAGFLVGSTGVESVRGIVTDSSGNYVVTGEYQGTVDFDPGTGSTQRTSLGNNDIFVAKYASDNSLIWAGSFGGTANEGQGNTGPIGSRPIAIDSLGNIFVTFRFDSASVDVDPSASVSNINKPGGSNSAVIVKLDATGNLLWGRSYGGASNTWAGAIDVDTSGNVYATSFFESGTTDFDPGAGTANLTASGRDSYVLKLTAAGAFGWAKQLGGSGEEHSFGLDVDNSGNVYTVGTFRFGTIDLDPGAGTQIASSAGNEDVYLSKLDTNGNYVWGVTFGGSNIEYVMAVRLDLNGNPVVVGQFSGTTDLAPGASVLVATSPGPAAAFVAKYLATDGSIIWGRTVGPTDYAWAEGAAIDALGNIYVVGRLSGSADFDPSAGTYTVTSAGGLDGFIWKLNDSGDFLDAGAIGGPGNDIALDVNTISTGQFMVVGLVGAGTVDLNPGAGNINVSPTTTDGFVAVLSTPPIPSVNLSVSTNMIAENAGAVTVFLSLSQTSSQTVTVSLGFSGTATADSDYSRSGTQVVIAPGQTSGNMTLLVLNDASDEPNESIILDITAVTNGVENGSQQTTIVVVDDDLSSPASLTISSSAMLEGNSGSSPLGFPVVRSGDLTQSLRATFVSVPGSATAEVDYQSTSSTITFPAGITSSSTFAVPVIGDATSESNETFQAALTQLDGVSGAVAFSAPQTMAAVDSVGVFIVDLNLDGRNDVVVTRLGSNSIAVFMNTTASGASSATFAAPQTFATPSQPCCIAAGDLNGDGRSDLIISSQAAANMSVFLNTTTAGAAAVSFASRVDFSTGSGPRGLAIADLNGDGRPDVLTANRYSNTLSILLNTTAAGAAAPSFSSKQDFATGDNPQSVTAQDINGDGRPDVAVANFYSSSVSVFLNNTAAGASSASLSTRTDFATVANSRTVAGGDLNGDGRPDLATANYNNGTISVLLNTTALGASLPSFTVHQEFSVDTKPTDIQFGDLNKDGKLDVLVTTRFQSSLSVLINSTLPDADSATFTSFQRIATQSDPLFLAVGDLNRDGLLDLATTSDSSDVLALVTNTTTVAAIESGWSTSSVNVGSGPQKVSSGDLNNDGRPDLIVSQSGTTALGVLLSTSLAAATVPTFSNQQDIQLGIAPNGSTTADVNNDGKLDLIVGLRDTNSSIVVFLNTTLPGATSFSYLPAQTFSLGAGWRAWDVSMRDLNGDGRSDFVVSATGFNRIVVIPNTTGFGSSTVGFGTSTAIDSGNCHNLVFADLNGDGLIDIISPESPGSTITLLRNTTIPGPVRFPLFAKVSLLLNTHIQ